MTGLLDKLTGNTSKDKTGQSGGGDNNTGNTEKQTFQILPHDAKTNNPDVPPNPPGLNPGQGSDGPGLNAARDPAFAVHSSTPGIVIPQDSEEFKELHVSSQEELQAQAAALNKPKQD